VKICNQNVTDNISVFSMITVRSIEFIFKNVVLCPLFVIMLAIGPKFRGFKPGRGLRIFKGDKNRRLISEGK
jgi:hypothetical protein